MQWGLPERKLLTGRALDACLRLCVGSAYASVSAGLERLWGSAPSPETLRRAALAEGQRVHQEQCRRAESVVAGEVQQPDRAPKRLYVALDGGYARGRERGQWYEGKLGTVYPDRRVTVSRGRRRVLGRRSVGTFESSQRLGELVYAEAFAQGVEAADQVVVLGDGAGWIRSIQQYHFPNGQLRLDAYHVLQSLGRGLRSAYPDDRARVRERHNALKDLIWDGRLDEALRRLRLIAHHQPQAAQLRETISYLHSQSEHIPAYGALQQRGEMISSSLVEERVDRAFNQRFKGCHRHWTRQGAEALLALRMLAERDEWDDYWHRRLQL